MTGPQGMGVLKPKIGNVFTVEIIEDFTSGLGTWDWNLVNSAWLSTDLGDVPWSVSGGNALLSGVNPGVLADNAGPSSPKMWASLENKEDLTAGGVRSARMFINFSRFANTAPSSTAYWGSFGRDAGGSYVAVGKVWNSVDTTWMKQYNPLPSGTVIRVRHDGIGTVTLDIDGDDVIEWKDDVFLRALGWGIGGQAATGEDVAVDNLQSGTWGTIGIPVPWRIGDRADTDQITAGLWTRTHATWPAWSGTSGPSGPSYRSQSGTSTTRFIRVSDTSLMLGDSFVEAGMDADTSVMDLYACIRANVTFTQGYYARWTADAGGKWQIGNLAGGEVASAAAANPGFYRMRFQAIGNTLKLFQWVTNTWVLRVTATDATWSAGTIGFGFNDVFNQGIPDVDDIVYGNIPTVLACRVERVSADVVTTDIAYFQIIFDEPTSDFTRADIVLSGSASGDCTVALSGSGRQYTAAVVGIRVTGEIELSVPAGGCTAITHGGSNTDSYSIDNTVTVTPETLLWWNDPDDSSFVTMSGSNIDLIADKSPGGLYDLDNTGTLQLVTIGSRDFIDFPNDATKNLHTAISWSLSPKAISVFCVVKLDTIAPAAQGLFFFIPAGANSDFHSFLIEVRGTRMGVSFGTGHEAGAINARQTATGIVAAGGTYVIGACMDTNSQPQIFVNGVEIGMSSFSGSLAPSSWMSNTSTTLDNFIGTRTGPSLPLDGQMGDCIGFLKRFVAADMIAISQGLMTRHGI